MSNSDSRSDLSFSFLAQWQIRADIITKYTNVAIGTIRTYHETVLISFPSGVTDGIEDGVVLAEILAIDDVDAIMYAEISAVEDVAKLAFCPRNTLVDCG